MPGITDDHESLVRRFLAPRYWPTWLGLGVLRVLALMPFAWQVRIGAAMGRLALRFSPHRRHVTQVNLELCFPELDSAQRHALLIKHFESLGIGMLETALSWWSAPGRLRPLTQIDGLENLHAALARGKGVILLSAHFTTLEIGGRLLAQHVPFHVMYREHKNALFEAVMKHARERHYEKAIERSDIRGMLRSLKNNRAVWYAPDQNYRGEHTVFVPFFGVPASTITATSRLARMSGAAVVPFFQHRLPGAQGYALTLLPALADFPSDDVETDTLRINQIIEAQVLKVPAQYLWAHRRFKTRPPGAREVY